MTTRPARVNFHWYPGASFSETVVLRDSAGAPLDLTGYTALMHIRREPSAPLVLYELSSETSGIELGGPDGSIALVVPATQTADQPVDDDGEMWAHDLLLTNANESPPVVDRVYQGYVFVHPGTTRT